MTASQYEHDHATGELYFAGAVVPAGIYRLFGTNINIELEEDGYLPASLDGRVACYEPIRFTWQQHQQQNESRPESSGP